MKNIFSKIRVWLNASRLIRELLINCRFVVAGVILSTLYTDRHYSICVLLVTVIVVHMLLRYEWYVRDRKAVEEFYSGLESIKRDLQRSEKVETS